MKLLPCFVLFLSLLSNWADAASDLGPIKALFRIDGIKIRGTKKVEVEAVLEKITSHKGMRLDNYTLKKDIETIYDLKYFDSVEAYIEEQGRKNYLVFVLKEKPIVAKIILEGNDEVDDDDINSQIKTKEYSILDVNSIKADVVSLQKYYEEKGFYLASIDYSIKKISKENVELTFKIKEFDKVRVKSITFLGSRVFSDRQLKSIMETKEEGLFSFMTGSGNFKEFNFQGDIERIKYFYKTKGYLLINVGGPEITVSEDKKWVFISIKLNEGPKFSVNEIFFDGEMLFTENELMEELSLKAGKDYSEAKMAQDIRLLTEKYQDKGYAFANVLRTIDIVPGENKVNIQFSFEKGKMAYFGKITVKGNTKTRDKVIRRELKIREGMRFSGTGLRESKESVNRLGFFEPGSVIFNTVSPKGRDDVLDVEISIKERNTGQITLGAGYSTSSKGFLQASIAQNNFRGLGQNLTFSLSLSGENQTYNLGFTEPYLWDTQWTAGGDIFSVKNETDSAHYLRKGFDLRVGHPIFEYTRLFVTYKLEDISLSNAEDPTIIIANEEGISSSVETSIIWDKRDNKFEPSKGHYANISAEYAGIGGDHNWLKNEVDARYYKTVVGELVLRTRLNLARLQRTTDKKIPRGKKFSLGGSRNMRGYSYEGIGPHQDFEVGDPKRLKSFNIGGLFSVYGTAELEHPLVKEAGLKWVLFYDVGNVFRRHYGEKGNTALRSDYGFGFRWFSPIGVLRFEFGYPINQKADETSPQFNFDIGQLF